jgi:hypothetical protein
MSYLRKHFASRSADRDFLFTELLVVSGEAIQAHSECNQLSNLPNS